MTKKWKDTTKDGYKILSREVHPSNGYMAGVVLTEAVMGVEWNSSGRAERTTQRGARLSDFDLVPAEPELNTHYVRVNAVELTKVHSPGYDNLKLSFIDGKLVSAEVIK